MRPRKIDPKDVEEITLTCTAKRTPRCAGEWVGPKREGRRFFRYNDENEPVVPVECLHCFQASAPLPKGRADGI